MDKYFAETDLLNLSVFDFFIITVVSFSLLYFSITTISYFIFKRDNFKKYQIQALRPGQIKTEIKRSFVSILMFGFLSVPIYFGLHSGFFKIHFEFSWSVLLGEGLLLFIWNEVHFYSVHRFFHLKPFYKFHGDHHYSHVPNPFSAYSFHWSEGILLGAVMPLIMCFHDFQVTSLMLLPLLSIGFNVLGHSNVDFFPAYSMNSIFSFSKRHSLHHKVPHANFGFFLPYLDAIFRTSGPDDESK